MAARTCDGPKRSILCPGPNSKPASPPQSIVCKRYSKIFGSLTPETKSLPQRNWERESPNNPNLKPEIDGVLANPTLRRIQSRLWPWLWSPSKQRMWPIPQRALGFEVCVLWVSGSYNVATFSLRRFIG